ncbi:MAG: D-glycero-beta-D-manno-heptose-1,7-bisphosphate 7-phosphatase [Elusimicrobia bacterium]|nr:D-glycero-beta-D-manno-heptose-1,7-bisphosphate 7-phosphatase [Elusimicrobiota bacterium]
MKKLKPAVFLDRDGTLIDERGYLSDPEKIFFYPCVYEALRNLHRAGFRLVVITNQSGVGRGYFSLKQLSKINQRFKKILAKKGARVDGIYFCPHHPEAGCLCRKPGVALARRAARDLNLDLKRSFVIGDQMTDMNMSSKLNIPGVLVLTGFGRSNRLKAKGVAKKITSNISTAARWILSFPQFR